MSAIFLLSVCLTYWPRKYTTRVDSHVDNFYQVWSCYVHTLPSYSVFVCWYVTWPCDIDLWPFDLEQLQLMAGYVSNLATKLEHPGISVLDLWGITLPVDYYWKCVQKQLHVWNPRPRFAYSLCNFGGSTMKVIKVIGENNSRPSVKRQMSFRAWGKSGDVLKVP